jgi:hypothetical protein
MLGGCPHDAFPGYVTDQLPWSSRTACARAIVTALAPALGLSPQRR